MNIFNTCRKTKSISVLVDNIIDWWKLLEEGVHSKGYTLQNGHAFRFRLHANKSVEFLYKLWATEGEWEYPCGGGTAFTGVYSKHPIGYVTKLPLDLNGLRTSMDNLKMRLGSGYDWWKTYLDTYEVYHNNRCIQCLMLRTRYKESAISKKDCSDLKSKKNGIRKTLGDELYLHCFPVYCKDFKFAIPNNLNDLINSSSNILSNSNENKIVDEKENELHEWKIPEYLMSLLYVRVKPIQNRSNILRTGMLGAMLGDSPNIFWIFKVYKLTSTKITVHWYNEIKESFELQFNDNEKKQPYIEVYNWEKFSLLHWDFILQNNGKLYEKDIRVIKLYLTQEFVIDKGRGPKYAKNIKKRYGFIFIDFLVG